MDEPTLILNEAELTAALRFCETCEDGEGYDVPKPMMRRLVDVGLLKAYRFGVYSGTDLLDRLQAEHQSGVWTEFYIQPEPAAAVVNPTGASTNQALPPNAAPSLQAKLDWANAEIQRIAAERNAWHEQYTTSFSFLTEQLATAQGRETWWQNSLRAIAMNPKINVAEYLASHNAAHPHAAAALSAFRNVVIGEVVRKAISLGICADESGYAYELRQLKT